MELLKATIGKSQLISTLKNVEEIRKTNNKLELCWITGFLEGLLYTLGEIDPSCPFQFKEVEYLEIGWLGQKKIKKREQTYLELMIEKLENLINKL